MTNRGSISSKGKRIVISVQRNSTSPTTHPPKGAGEGDFRELTADTSKLKTNGAVPPLPTTCLQYVYRAIVSKQLSARNTRKITLREATRTLMVKARRNVDTAANVYPDTHHMAVLKLQWQRLRRGMHRTESIVALTWQATTCNDITASDTFKMKQLWYNW